MDGKFLSSNTQDFIEVALYAVVATWRRYS